MLWLPHAAAPPPHLEAAADRAVKQRGAAVGHDRQPLLVPALVLEAPCVTHGAETDRQITTAALLWSVRGSSTACW
jgi:hypothetical protein